MSLLPPVNAEDFAGALGGADYGEVYLEDSRGSSIRYEDSRVEDIASSEEKGLALRYLVRRDGAIETRQGSSQDLGAAAALRLRRQVLGAPPAPVAFNALTAFSHPVRVDPAAISIDAKIALLKLIDETVRREFPLARQLTLTYSERRREIAILNSDGAFRREERVSVIFSAVAVAEQDGVLQTGMEVIGGLKGYEILSDFDALAFSRAAARRAELKLSAPKAQAGQMPVVLSSSAGGTFIHEAIGHSLEADHVQEGSSPAYKGKLGSVVAPENITVVDDPTLPGYRGSFRFDDEGLEAKPTPLVKNGVLVDYLYDRVTAMRAGLASNGHGRRESFQCRPIPRMSNLYIAPGTDDPREILRGLKSGLFVTRMGGGQVNTATGEFVFEVDEGFKVEDGVIKHMVRDANLLGVGPEVLRSIDRVGWDIGWGIGTCGKDGQGVPVGDGQPTIRMPDILVGGKNE